MNYIIEIIFVHVHLIWCKSITQLVALAGLLDWLTQCKFVTERIRFNSQVGRKCPLIPISTVLINLRHGHRLPTIYLSLKSHETELREPLGWRFQSLLLNNPIDSKIKWFIHEYDLHACRDKNCLRSLINILPNMIIIILKHFHS